MEHLEAGRKGGLVKMYFKITKGLIVIMLIALLSGCGSVILEP